MTAKLKTAVLGATDMPAMSYARLCCAARQKPTALTSESGGGIRLDECRPPCGNGGCPLEPFSIEKLKHAGVDLLLRRLTQSFHGWYPRSFSQAFE
jgi:hypothetical protein